MTVAVSLVTTLVLTSYIRPQISRSVGGTGQALTALVWLSYFQSSVLWVLSQSSSRQTAAGGLGNLSLFYGIWIKYWCDFDWGIRQPSVHQYRQFASSFSLCGIFDLRPLCNRLSRVVRRLEEMETGSLHGEAAGRTDRGETGRVWDYETVRLWWLFWPSHQTQSSSGSPGRLGCQHNIMSFFKTSSSRHGLGQIVHLANKDLIIISVVIRIKWTKEKIASWLNHQNDFKTHLLNINSRSTDTNHPHSFFLLSNSQY